MLSDNIKRIRKSKGLSQEELAIKLNVVRQTVSKRENGLSVPDSDMLIFICQFIGLVIRLQFVTAEQWQTGFLVLIVSELYLPV